MANTNQSSSSDLLFWAQLFATDSVELDPNKLDDGTFLANIFQQITTSYRFGRKDENALCRNADTIKARLRNWHYIVRNLRNYYLEVLQEAVTMRPPNIVLISKIPNSAQAHQERESILLLLLCAAVRCDRRDHFIRQIMDRLTPEVQAGMMNCIKTFTESPDCVSSFDRMQCSASDFLRVLKTCINQLEDVYLEEIHDLLDQLDILQHKFTTLQARVRLTCRGRARSVGRVGLSDRSVSTVSLGDPTRGEVTTSTPRLQSYENEFCSSNPVDSISPTVTMRIESGSRSNQADGSRVAEDEETISAELHRAGHGALVSMLDSGLDAELDVDHSHSLGTLYADASDPLYPDVDRHHLAVELAETKAKLRRVRNEFEDQADQLAELHEQLSETRRELGQVKEERARLADAAHSARHWQDEVDALRETAERVAQLETENARLKQRTHEIEYYKARCQQLTEDLAILSDENAKRSSLVGNESFSREKVASLEQELHRTRNRLAQIEELRNSDLDQVQKLREELGRLGLEHSSRQQVQSVQQNDHSDTESTASQASFNATLSKQLTDSVAVRLDQLESENRRLHRELERVRHGPTDVVLIDSQSANQGASDPIYKESVSQIETEIRKIWNGLAELKSSFDRCVKEFSQEASFLSDTMKVPADQPTSADKISSPMGRLKDQHDVVALALHEHDERLTHMLSDLNRLCAQRNVKLGQENLLFEKQIAKSELCELRSKVEQLQIAFQDSKKKLVHVEAERDDLASQVSELKHKFSLRSSTQTTDDPFADDEGADEETDNAAEDDGPQVENTDDTERDDGEEVDSGNKTGDSTEEADPCSLDPLRRKQFNLPGTTGTRYRERRRKPRTNLDSEIARLGGEVARLEEVNRKLNEDLERSQLECRTKIAELHSTKQAMETLRQETQSSTDGSKVEHLESELKRFKLALSSAEHETRKARRDLREAQANPSTTEQGKLLVTKISQLETQLSKATQSHQLAESQYQSRLKQLEQEHDSLSQQLGAERQSVLTLREQLVEAKIQLQNRSNLLKQFQLSLEAVGVDKDQLQCLVASDNASSHGIALQDLIERVLQRAVEEKSDELKRVEDRLKRLQQSSQTPDTTPTRENGTVEDMFNGYAGEGKHNELLVQFKNRMVELERENARLELERKAESVSSDEARTRLMQLEQRLSTAQEQMASGQSQLAELIATNARLQVESTTLHNQLDSLSGQNNCLYNRNTELENETKRLHAMIESAHAAEAHLTADYYHLQRLHEKLTRDYDCLGQSLKEAKESQRRLKNELSNAQLQIERLQSNSDQVYSLKEALELERGSLKGEARQMVILREDCARLRAQIDSITESRDRERVDKAAAIERAREARRQLEECENRASSLTVDLDNQRNANVKIQIEVTDLRSRIQILTELNSKLEKDNRSLILQLQSMLGQNQELLASTLETCTHRVAEEGVLRERLLSLQRQKQHLEDKMVEQYRNNSQPKNDVTDVPSPGTQKRMTLVQKARAALTKRKDSLNTHHNGDICKSANGPTADKAVRDTLLSVNSQFSLSNESSGSSNSLSSLSMRKSQSTNRLVPGSVSIYDRDPDECDTSEFHVFLKRLDSSKTASRPDRTNSLNATDHKPVQNGTDPCASNGYGRPKNTNQTAITAKFIRTQPVNPVDHRSTSPTAAVIRSARHPSGDQPRGCDSPRTTRLPRSNSSLPVDQFHQQHHFPHQPISGATNTQLDALRTRAEFVRPDHGHSRSELVPPGSTKQSSTELRSDIAARNYRMLPCTDRCEKQLCEIVTTKATSEDNTSAHGVVPSRSGSEVSRSSSIHSFASSSAQPGLPSNGSQPSLVTVQQRADVNSMTSAVGTALKTNPTQLFVSRTSKNAQDSGVPAKLGVEARPQQPNCAHKTDRWTSQTAANPIDHIDSPRSNTSQPNSMDSVLNCRSPRIGFTSSTYESGVISQVHDDLDQRPTLEVVGRPRVLLEYGDL